MTTSVQSIWGYSCMEMSELMSSSLEQNALCHLYDLSHNTTDRWKFTLGTSGLRSCIWVYLLDKQQLQSAHSQHKAESEAMINTLHKVYIDRSLVFSRDNHVVDLWRPRLPILQGWQFCTRSEEAYHLWSKHALVQMQTKWHLII